DSASVIGGAGISGRVFAVLSGPLTDATDAKTLRTEPLTANGRSVNCTVIETSYAPAGKPATTRPYWIDPATHRVLQHRNVVVVSGRDGRETSQAETIAYQEIALDTKLPEDLFTFTPPPTSMEVVAFRSKGTETIDLSGQPAGGLPLCDVAGAP